MLDGPARWPVVILFFGDFPFSALAFGRMFMSDQHTWLAWSLWGVLGTIWWYFLGLSIEARIRRFSKRREWRP
jgi:hypothetical protein